MLIFLLCDFGSKYGFGHLSRCSNLSLHLEKRGIKSALISSKRKLVGNQKELLKKFLIPFGNNIFLLEKLENKEQIALNMNALFINNLIKNLDNFREF